MDFPRGSTIKKLPNILGNQHPFNDDDFILDGTVLEDGGELQGPACKTLCAYWLSLLENSGPTGPEWHDVKLMDLYKIAPQLIVKDVIAGGEAFLNRYWGTRITDAFGIDATGLCESDYLKDRAVEKVQKFLQYTIRELRYVKISGTAKFFPTREFLSFEAVYIPIFDKDMNPTQILLTFDFD